MLTPIDTLIIGIIAGFAFGYPLGFFMARAIYRRDHPCCAEYGQMKREIKRLRLFLGEIAAMGPADEEWDADTLESAIALAKRAIANL